MYERLNFEGSHSARTISDENSWWWISNISQMLSWVWCFVLGNIFSLFNFTLIGFCSLVSHAFKILILVFRIISGVVNIISTILYFNFNLISAILRGFYIGYQSILAAKTTTYTLICNIFTSLSNLASDTPFALWALFSYAIESVNCWLQQLTKNIGDMCAMVTNQLTAVKSSLLLSCWTVAEIMKTGIVNLFCSIGSFIATGFKLLLLPVTILIENVVYCLQAAFAVLKTAVHNIQSYISYENFKHLMLNSISWIEWCVTESSGFILNVLNTILDHCSSVIAAVIIILRQMTTQILSPSGFITLTTGLFLLLVFLHWTYVTYYLGMVTYKMRTFFKHVLPVGSQRTSVPTVSDCCGQTVLDDLITCVVCQDQPKTVLLMPCKHLCLCKNCLKQLFSMRFNRRVCPICRTYIRSTIDVYM